MRDPIIIPIPFHFRIPLPNDASRSQLIRARNPLYVMTKPPPDVQAATAALNGLVAPPFPLRFATAAMRARQ